MKTVYLDNNATTRVAPEVLEAMLPHLSEHYGNPSSMHRMGAKAAAIIKNARERISAFLRCKESELIFTSSGTESNNLAIRGALEATPAKMHIVSSKVEHSSILNVLKRMEPLGYRITLLDVAPDGTLDPDHLRQALTDDTALVSIMYANNETGVLFPVEAIASITKERGVPLMVDAIQAVGKIPIDLSALDIDLMSFSGHKFHAPKGIGGLFVRKGTRIRPMMLGGSQEKGLRAGTENIAFIAAMATACELAEQHLHHVQTDTKRLRDALELGALTAIPGSRRIGHCDNRLPNTSNISFASIEGEAVLLLMDELGICASTGSACTSGAVEPSHVLKAMGLGEDEARNAVRFSLSRYTTEQEIDLTLTELPRIIERLRSASSIILRDE
ncbi:MAG: cysteine desulfurase NifS [Candidatus Latescibacterota bacterium]